MAKHAIRTMNNAAGREPGSVLALLALGRGEDAIAVTTHLAVTRMKAGRDAPFTFCGPVEFEETAVRHYEKVVLPLVQQTVGVLGIGPLSYVLSMTNLGAASVQDRSMTVSGFSADAALFLACLSAMIEAPVLPGVAVTGHIASLRGDVRMVRSLPAKLRAAATSPVVEAVLFPDPGADDSLAALTPEEKLAIEEAIRSGRDRFRMTPVRDVAELIRGAFAEHDLIRASLHQGYFGKDVPTDVPIPGLAVLAADLPNRFWTCMEDDLHGRAPANVIELLCARMAYQISVKVYPAGFGTELYRLLSSVPPGLRHSRLTFPLLPAHDALAMVQLASPTDLEDLRRFLDAVAGDRFQKSMHSLVDGLRESIPSTANEHVVVLLDAIDSETLYRTVGAAVETARGLFTLETVTAQDKHECLDVVTSFYVHTLRYCGIAVQPNNPAALAADAADLLERAFARQGGAKGAYAEACSGTRGRLRYVLDVVTEQFRAEAEEKERNRAFQEVLGSLEYDEQVALVKAFMDHLGPQLPEDVLSSRPERYVQHAEVLLRAYAQASSRFKQLVRAL